jgi:prevent-host-death family protein
MDPLPEMVPISEMRTRQNELLAQAAEAPLVLTQHGRAVAVLLGPDSYNRLLEHVEDLQLSIDGALARADNAPPTDFEDYLAERGDHVPAASDQ